jgi:hypothetical protein
MSVDDELLNFNKTVASVTEADVKEPSINAVVTSEITVNVQCCQLVKTSITMTYRSTTPVSLQQRSPMRSLTDPSFSCRTVPAASTSTGRTVVDTTVEPPGTAILERRRVTARWLSTSTQQTTMMTPSFEVATIGDKRKEFLYNGRRLLTDCLFLLGWFVKVVSIRDMRN